MSQSARNLFLLDVLGYLDSSVTYPYYRSLGVFCLTMWDESGIPALGEQEHQKFQVIFSRIVVLMVAWTMKLSKATGKKKKKPK